MKPKTMTGADVKALLLPELQSLEDDDLLYFGNGNLSLYRLKERGPVEGPRMLQVEFNEVYEVVIDA
jgi:hypothetical protein